MARSAALERLGVAVCWGLFGFDLLLGGVATLAPDLYLGLFHPTLDAPQVELVRRTGMLWLAFSAVALRAATAAPTDRARWYLVLAVLRLMDVPADIVYASTITGASRLSLILLGSAPPLNLALGGLLYVLSRRMRADGASAAQPRS
ncbi:MAG: hypothetical protein Tsb0020_37890 [Haliangiales bacterium]